MSNELSKKSSDVANSTAKASAIGSFDQVVEVALKDSQGEWEACCDKLIETKVIWNVLYSYAHRLSTRISQNDQSRRDLAHDLVVVAWERIRKWDFPNDRDQNNFKALFFQFINKVFLNRYSSLTSTAQHLDKSADAELEAEIPEALHPNAIVEQEDWDTAVLKAVRRCALYHLMENESTVFLGRLRKIPLKELASKFGVKPARISQIYHEAVSKVRPCIQSFIQRNKGLE